MALSDKIVSLFQAQKRFKVTPLQKKFAWLNVIERD
jgi:hypothetical protein